MKKRSSKFLALLLALLMLCASVPAFAAENGADAGSPNGAPAAPSVTHNAWNGDPDYTVTFNIWWGNNATSYKLYENGALIESGALAANSPNGQNHSWAFTGKANGAYTYKVELANAYGSASGSTTLNVTNGSSTPVDPVNQPPVLYGVKNQTLTVGDSFDPMKGVTATDKEDGDLTAAVKVSGSVDTAVPGSYTLIYSVTDNDGAESTAKAVITVKENSPGPEPENTAPVLKGVQDQALTVGDSFDPMKGVTATDKEDGDLTAAVKVSGSVDTANPGSYTLTYSVTDKGGLTATAKAVITVNAAGGGAQATVWAAGVAYKLGDIVSYSGKYYECTFAHTSLDGWQPINAAALWKLYTGPVVPTDPENPDNPDKPDEPKPMPSDSPLPGRVLTGYWQNFTNGAANLKLGDVPEEYNIICISFADATTTPGELTFNLDPTLAKALGGYTVSDFKADVIKAHDKGQKVILAVGGEVGNVTVNSDASAKAFADSAFALMQEYGFDGVDIDLEHGINVTYLAKALRQLAEKAGPNFILTMAPQTMDIYTYDATYLKLAREVSDILTIMNTQYYNSGGMPGYGGANYNQGTIGFLTSLATTQLESGLRPDQVGLGLPATSQAAGGGYQSPSNVTAALESLVHGTEAGGFTPPKAYNNIRGAMTWSINWDATNNYNFAKTVSACLKALPPIETEGSDPEPENTAPVLKGVKDQALTVGDSFDPMKGVTATDKEDGDLTAAVKVSGSVDTAKPGSYTLTYSVTDKGGLTATAKAVITVKENSPAPEPENTAPVLKGVQDQALTVGDSFDPMKGVTATDKEDGDLTAAVKVSGNVDTAKPGSYTLTYSVTDKGGLTVTAKAVITVKEKSPAPTPADTSHLLIGYWHTWGGTAAGGVPFVKLRDVDSNWDVINIAFAEPVSPGSTDGRMKLELAGLSADYTKEDFKADIKALQAQGKKIVLSIGGYEGYFSLTSPAAVNQFVSDIKGFVDEYGFDGIDIDLEQSSVTFDSGNDPELANPTSPKVVNMIGAIRQICAAYGDDFILSWAPETFYMQMGYQFYGGLNAYCDSRSGVYLPMINALRDETTYVHVQLYNSIAITAPDGKIYSMGSADSTVAMCKMLLDGFNVYGREDQFFAPLRPDQVVIGVPSSAGAAGSGHISNSELQKAFTTLNAQYPGLRGIMTWSINWDAFQNNSSFAQSNGAFLDAQP